MPQRDGGTGVTSSRGGFALVGQVSFNRGLFLHPGCCIFFLNLKSCVAFSGGMDRQGAGRGVGADEMLPAFIHFLLKCASILLANLYLS